MSCSVCSAVPEFLSSKVVVGVRETLTVPELSPILNFELEPEKVETEPVPWRLSIRYDPFTTERDPTRFKESSLPPYSSAFPYITSEKLYGKPKVRVPATEAPSVSNKIVIGVAPCAKKTQF